MLKHSSYIGQVLNGRYEIQKLLGEGGMGQVVLAWDQQAREEKAVKIVDVRKKKVPLEAILRFKTEAETLKSLSHPSIIHYENFFNEADLYGLVMEYETSSTLSEYLAEHKHLSIKQCFQLLYQMTEALMFIHNKGLVHHDLKGSNILVNIQDEKIAIKLLDFGFAKLVGVAERRAGGTLTYMAPEQTGILQKTVDHRADLYSLGVILYHTLTGQVPFLSEDPAILVHQHIATPPDPPSMHRKGIPEVLEKITLKLLNKDPEDRYHTTSGLFNDLKKYKRFVNETGNPGNISFTLGEEDHWHSFQQSNPFVGRDELMKKLSDFYEQLVSEKKGGFVLLEGIKGIGKSRVIKEFYNSLQGKPGKSWFLKIHQEQYELPYKLFKRLFGYLVPYLKSIPQIEQERVIEHLKSSFDFRFELFLEMVPELKAWIDDEASEVVEQEATWAASDYETLLITFLQGVTYSGNHLVIFIDNFQNVGKFSTTSLLESYAKIVKLPVLIIATYVQEEASSTLLEKIQLLQGHPQTLLTNVLPFREEHYADLLLHLFSNKLFDAALLIAPLYRVTHGNPTVLRSVLQELIDEKLIRYQGGQWTYQRQDVLEYIRQCRLGHTAQDLRTQWNEREFDLLQRGAVFLRAFTWEALMTVSEVPPKIEGVTEIKILQFLDEAVTKGVLSLDQTRLYSFRDNKIRQNLLESFLPENRQRVHKSIADHLERFHLPNSSETIYDIAYHAEKSGDSIFAMETQLRAAQLTDDGMYRDQKAEIYYRLALKWLLKSPAEQISDETQFKVRYNAIRHAFSSSPDFEKLWEETLELEQFVKDIKVRKLKILYLKTFLSFVRDRKDMMFQYGQEAIEMMQLPDDELYAMEIYNMLGRVASERSYTERIDLLLYGIESAQKYKKYNQMVPSLFIVVILMAYQARFEEAKELTQRVTFPLRDHRIGGSSLENLVFMAMETERGNYPEVIELEKDVDYNSPAMGRNTSSFIHWRIALAKGMSGYFKESLQLFDRMLEGDNFQSFRVARLDALAARIMVALRMEEPETALHYLDLTTKYKRRDPDPLMEANLAILTAQAHIMLGQLEEGSEHLAIAEPFVNRLDSLILKYRFQFITQKLKWERTKSQEVYRETVDLLNEMAELGITGYYEIFKEDLSTWATFTSDSSSQLSSFLSSNLEMTQLMEVNRKISATLDLDSLFDMVLENAMKIAGAEQGYLFICDDESMKLDPHLLPALILTRNAQGNIIPVNQYAFSKTIVRKVMQTKISIITRDARNEKRWNKFESLYNSQLRSILATPILLKDEIKGILYLDNHLASSVFSLRDKEVVEMFATQVAIAIKNAQIYNQEQEARKQTEATLKTFERFIPRQFTERFAEGNIENLTTGLCEKEYLTILFSDIRRFTTFSEKMTPDETFKFLNAYLRRMDIPIRKHHGFVDKFIGDAIMALFDRSPQDAVSAAIDMFHSLDDYNENRLQKGKSLVNIGIGINSGEVVVGVIGSRERTDTTVLGDAVNIASRVESLTKYYGCKLLITGTTHSHLTETKGLLIRQIDEVQVKGKKEITQIYEVFNTDSEQLKEKKQKYYGLFKGALEFYRQGQWEVAEKLFWKYVQNIPEDQVGSRFIQRCQVFMKFPPEGEWTGIYPIENK